MRTTDEQTAGTTYWSPHRVGLGTLALACAFIGHAQELIPDWSVHGDIGYAVERTADGSKYFIAGALVDAGPPTGQLAFLDRGSLAPDITFPRVLGEVATITDDGEGGWFIGGGFSHVNGMVRSRLARILGDGSLSDWAIGANGHVAQMLTVGDTLIAVGGFTTIGTVPRDGFAAFSISSGELLPWDPQLSAGSSIDLRSVAIWGDAIYITGSFDAVDSQSRPGGLAAFDRTTGALLPWSQGQTGTVLVLHATAQGIIVGGDFHQVGAHTRRFIAMLHHQTGEVLPWDAGITGGLHISTVTSDQDHLYIAGNWTGIQGQNLHDLASLDLASASLLPFQADGPIPAVIYDLELLGDTLLLAGTSTMGTSGLQAYDVLTGVGLDLGVRPSASSSNVVSLWADDQHLLVGGTFTFLPTTIHDGRVYAVDGVTGALDPWRLNPAQFLANNIQPKALLVKGDTLFAMAVLSGTGQRLCAIDVHTGDYLGWNLDVPNVLDLGLVGSTLYLVGPFTTVNGVSRGRGAAWDLANNVLLDWDPQANATINSLVAYNGAIHLGGSFVTLGEESRSRYGAVDAVTGQALQVDLACNASVQDMVSSGDTLYICGGFSSIAGEPRTAIGAVDMSSGTLLPWAPTVAGNSWSGDWNSVYAVAVAGNIVYVGGSFNMLSGAQRRGFGRLDRTTGAALEQVASLTSVAYVRAIHATPELAVAVGGFSVVNQRSRPGMFAIANCPLFAYYLDADGDGYGDPAALSVQCIPAPDGYVDNALDCDDQNDAVWTGGPCETQTGAPGFWSEECICLTSTGVNAPAADVGFHIFPNPSAGLITLENPWHGPVSLAVYDPSGRCVLKWGPLLIKGHHIVDLGELASGTYFLELSSPGYRSTRTVLLE